MNEEKETVYGFFLGGCGVIKGLSWDIIGENVINGLSLHA